MFCFIGLNVDFTGVSRLSESALAYIYTKDAPGVTGYGELVDGTPSKVFVNVLQDAMTTILYAHFHFSISIRSEISSVQRSLPSRILLCERWSCQGVISES